MSNIQFAPIGIVHNQIREAHRDTPWEEIESKIAIDEQWCDALDGITEFSHIWIVYHIDQVPPPDALHIHPMKQADMALVGIFATRSPQRPNPIGIAAVQLLEVHDNVMRVRGLDTIDGTPVLDIKPYLALGDSIANTRVASWVKQYWQSRNLQDPKGF